MNTLRLSSIFKLTAILAVLSVAGCSALGDTGKGALVGAGAGAAGGAVAGAILGDTAKGAIIGAAVGGTAGAIIGRQMSRQAEELEQEIDGATVEQLEEGIAIKFDSGLLFGFDSATLSPTAQSNLQKLANSLETYDNTNVHVIGHTDDTGPDEYNQRLSEQRAQSAVDYLTTLGVTPDRLIVRGLGEEDPLVDNDSDENRAMNRRIEVVIVANEEFREEAQEQS